MEISSCLIGEDSLLIQCGNYLLERDHSIRLIISPNPTIQEWAKDQKLPWITTVDELTALEAIEFDYLFSIVNSRILPLSILKLAKKHAINYHDSLLPKYAGLNATSWAILNNEKEHGITWHRMNERIDEGDIIIQRRFPIESKDTALTLNLRCYETAILAFKDMVGSIEKDTLAFKKQCISDRSYYAAVNQLPCFGFINWQTLQGETIESMSRALTLGHYNNNVGSLKLVINKSYWIVSQIELTESLFAEERAPGIILAMDKDSITISTITRPCKITRILSKNGEDISISNFINQEGLFVGHQFASLTDTDELYINKYHRLALRSERYWIDRIKGISEHNTFPPQSMKPNGGLERLDPVISLTNLFPTKYIANKTQVLIAAILVYLYRLNEHEQVAVSLLHADSSNLSLNSGALFTSFLPFLFDKQGDFSLQDVIKDVTHQLKNLEKYPTFLTDIAARHPILEGNHMDPGIVIQVDGDAQSYPCQENTVLYFSIDSKRGNIEVLHRIDLSYHGSELSEVMAHCTQHLVSIVIQIVNHPHLNARQLCFLTQSERYKLLTVWGKGAKRYLPTQSLTTIFEAQVSKNPNKIAIYMKDKAVTYAELSQKANQIASFLQHQQVTKQSFVGLYLNRSIEMIATLLGILKAGCTYVPLDPKYPMLKIEQILEDAGVRYLFIEENDKAKFIEFLQEQQRAVDLFIVNDILDRKENELVVEEDELAQGKIAYIMFTSGTTGRPKGVVVYQKNILNYCKWFTETTHFDEEGVIDFSSSIAFDLSVPCTLAPLLVGGSIAIATSAQKSNPKLYLKHLKAHKVTHTELTPGYIEMLLNHPEEIKGLIDLRFLLLGADVVPTNDVIRWLNLCPQHQVVNEYGPTETTVSATSYFVNKNTLVNEASVPIGRPAYNTSCYVLDKYKNLCPIGVRGELYIGGEQVTGGYFNREDLTQSKFVTLNLSGSKELLYKTGDIVCWLPDGNLQFFGRNDHQVKIQGYRVELPAIEAILLKIPGIVQAVVLVMSGKLKENYLRAYLVTDKTQKSSSEIRAFLASYLPNYMVPREFCVIKSIPLKENEKIDFTALERQGYQLLSYDAETGSLDLTPTEKVLKSFWEEVFHAPLTDLKEDFFAVGGDSLMALQLMSALRNHFHLPLPLQLLFEYPTVQTLAQKIESLISDSNSSTAVDLALPIPLVKLAMGKEPIPLFLIHPVGGSIFWYKQLAPHLEGKYTIYGIQDVHLDGGNQKFNSLEGMAQFYLQEIKKVYSGNVYCLGGASFGATVAFEIAQQLLREKKSIQFLGLFDGWAHYPVSILNENTLDWLSQSEMALGILDKKTRERLIALEQYRKNLLTHYELKPLKSNATLFKASELWESFVAIDDCKNGWSNFIKGYIATYSVPGNHETMFFEPNVQHLANSLLTAISSESVCPPGVNAFQQTLRNKSEPPV